MGQIWLTRPQRVKVSLQYTACLNKLLHENQVSFTWICVNWYHILNREICVKNWSSIIVTSFWVEKMEKRWKAWISYLRLKKNVFYRRRDSNQFFRFFVTFVGSSNFFSLRKNRISQYIVFSCTNSNAIYNVSVRHHSPFYFTKTIIYTLKRNVSLKTWSSQ